MRLICFAAFVLLFAGCTSNSLKKNVSVAESLDSARCGVNELRGFGVGANEEEALAVARSFLAMQIESSVKVSNNYRKTQQVTQGREALSSDFESAVFIEATLKNAQDARVHRMERNEGEVGMVLCITKADIAKPYLQREIRLKDSITFAASEFVSEHPMQKSKARNKVNSLWNKFLANREFLLSWGIESDIAKVKEIRDTLEQEYKNYCKTAKLYWNAEPENRYSETAFAKLSQKIKMVKSACEENGISLVYKDSETKCEYAGVFKCFHQPSLMIRSCEGKEHRILKSPGAESFHQKEDIALERLQTHFMNETFWKKWEQEIKQWSPECE